jgi:hypothetical protein
VTLPEWMSLGSALVAGLALAISVVALWQSHFSRFSPIFTVGTCWFRVYPIKSGDERWFIPSLDVRIGAANAGAQTGVIEDFRVSVRFPGLPTPGHYQIFDARWRVDGTRISRNRFKWLHESTVEDWMPFLLLPKATETVHLVFEPIRWERPVIDHRVDFRLEGKTSRSRDWVTIEEWTIHLTAGVWSRAVRTGTVYALSAHEEGSREPSIFPPDLFKQIGSEDLEPDDLATVTSSYLDFPLPERYEARLRPIANPPDALDEHVDTTEA